MALGAGARSGDGVVLREHGVAAGDRVNVHLTNRPEFYDLWFAAARRGAIRVPTNPALTPDEPVMRSPMPAAV